MALSRRQFLTSSCAAIAASALITVDPASATLAAISSNQQPNLLSPKHPLFNYYFDTHFPGLRTQKRFAQLLPFSAIVKNTSNEPIYGYSFEWTSTTGGGNTETYKRNYTRRPSKQLLKRQFTGQFPFLYPGEVALVTPLFFWPATTYQQKFTKRRLSSKQLAAYQSRYPRASSFTLRNQVQASQIVTSIGATLTSTPSPGFLQKVTTKAFRNQRNAERDQAVDLFQRSMTPTGELDKGLLLSAVNKSLEIYRPQPNQKHRIYAKARVAFCQRVYHLSNVKDMGKVKQVLLEVGSLQKVTLA